MNRIKAKVARNAKRAGRLPTRDAAKEAKENSSLSSPNCTSIDSHLSSLIDQARRFMDLANARHDSPAFYAHFEIWQSLTAARYGLPWPGVTNG